MSKNVKVNGTNYEGVSIVELPLTDGSGNAQFKDVDEIVINGDSTVQVVEETVTVNTGFDLTTNPHVERNQIYVPYNFGGELPDLITVELQNLNDFGSDEGIFVGSFNVNMSDNGLPNGSVTGSCDARGTVTRNAGSSYLTSTINLGNVTDGTLEGKVYNTVTKDYIPVLCRVNSSTTIKDGSVFKVRAVKF